MLRKRLSLLLSFALTMTSVPFSASTVMAEEENVDIIEADSSIPDDAFETDDIYLEDDVITFEPDVAVPDDYNVSVDEITDEFFYDTESDGMIDQTDELFSDALFDEITDELDSETSPELFSASDEISEIEFYGLRDVAAKVHWVFTDEWNSTVSFDRGVFEGMELFSELIAYDRNTDAVYRVYDVEEQYSVTEDGCIILDGALLSQGMDNPEDYYCIMTIGVKEEDQIVAEGSFELYLYNPFLDYTYPSTGEEALPGYSFHIGETRCYRRDKDFPEGTDYYLETTDVQYSGDEGAVEITKNYDSDFTVEFVKPGSGEITVTFKNFNSEYMNYTFPVVVLGGKLQLEYVYPNDSNGMLNGYEMEIATRASYSWVNGDGDIQNQFVEDYSIEIIKDNADMPSYDSDKIDVSVLEDGKTLKILSKGEPTKETIAIRAAAYIPAQDELMEVTIEDQLRITVGDENYYIEGSELPSNLLPGETAVFVPKTIRAFLDANGNLVYENVEGILRYELIYDEEKLDIRDKSGKYVGCTEGVDADQAEFSVTRLTGEPTMLEICSQISVDGYNYYEHCTKKYYLDEKMFTLSFDGLNEDCVLFDNEECEIQITSDFFEREPEASQNAGIVCSLYSFEREDFFGTTEENLNMTLPVSKDGVLVLKGSELKDLTDFSKRFLFVKVEICSDDAVYITDGFPVFIEETFRDYDYNRGPYKGVPGCDFFIDYEFGEHVNEKEHMHEEYSCFVTDISLEVIEGNQEEWEVWQDDHENWHVNANSCGRAVVTVSFVEFDGSESSYQVEMYVDSHAYYLNHIYPYGVPQMLPGSEMRLETCLDHDWNVSEEEKGSERIENYTLTIAEDEDGNPLYDTNALEAYIDDDGKTVIVRSKGIFGGYDIPIVAQAVMFEGTDAAYLMETDDTIYVDVSERYFFFDNLEIPENLMPGTDYTISPVMKMALITDENTGESEVIDAEGQIRYAVDFDENCVQVFDAEGKQLVSGQASECANTDLTIRKTENTDIGIAVIAQMYNEEDGQWNEILRSEHNLNEINHPVWYDNLREDGNTWVFSDEELMVPMHSDIFDDVDPDQLKVEWKLFSYVYGDETGESEETIDYEIPVEDRTAVLRGEDLVGLVNTEERNLYVKTFIMCKDIIVAEGGFGLWIEEPTRNYEYDNRDITLLLDDQRWIDKTISVWLKNSEYPYGERMDCTVTNVEVRHESGDNPVILEPDPEGCGWNLIAEEYGDSVVTVEFTDYDGSQAEYSYHVYVSGDIVRLNWMYPNDTDNMLKNDVIEIATSVDYGWNYDRDDCGWQSIEQYKLELCADDEGNPFYDKNLIDVEIEEDGKTLRVSSKEECYDTDIPVRAICTVRGDTPDAFEMEVYEEIHINVCDGVYYYTDIQGWDDSIETGDSFTITPSIIMRGRNENGEDYAVPVDCPSRYRIYYNMDSLEVKDTEGNPVEDGGASDNGFVITRLDNNDIAIQLRGDILNNQDGDDNWEECTGIDKWLDARFYDLDVEGLRDDGFTWLFPGEELKIQVRYNSFDEEDDKEVVARLYRVLRADENVDEDINVELPVAEDNTFIVSASQIEEVLDLNDYLLEVKVLLRKNGYVLEEKSFRADVWDSEEIYNVEENDQSIVVDNDYCINKFTNAYVKNAEHPFGDWVDFEISNVTVKKNDPFAIGKICTVYDEGDHYRIHANSYGSVRVYVTYPDINGNERTSEFNLYVSSDVLYLDVRYPDDSDQMIPGMWMPVWTNVSHEWNYGGDERGARNIEDYRIEIVSNEDGTPTYDEGLIEASVAEDGQSLNIVANNENRVGDTDILIRTEILLDEGTETERTIDAYTNVHVHVTEAFWLLVNLDYDRMEKSNVPFEINPVVKQFRYDENGSIVEDDPENEVRYRMEYDSNEFEVEESENGLIITRHTDYSCGMRLIAEEYNSAEDSWDEICAGNMNFEEVEHDWAISYDWSADGKRCYAMAYCKNDIAFEFDAVYAEMVEDIEPTCTESEKITYVARFGNDLFEEQTNVVEGKPALGHTYVNNKCKVCGEYQKLSVPALEKVENTKNGIKLTWTAVKDAKRYHVYRRISGGIWEKIANATGTSYEDTTAVAGKKYAYSVCCVANDGSDKEISKYNTTGLVAIRLKAITPTLANAAKGVKISWSKVAGATKYIVYRRVGSGSYANIATITSASTVTYTDTTAVSGTNYAYCVKAANGSSVSVPIGKSIRFLSAVTPTLTNVKNTIKIRWKKVTGATGYVIYRKAGSGKYAKLATISSGKTVSYVDKKVKKGTTYTYYVYAINGTTKGAYVAKTLKKN